MNFTVFHMEFDKLTGSNFPYGVYNLSTIGPIATVVYDDRNMLLVDIEYGGDLFYGDGALLAGREEVGKTVFNRPVYNLNTQLLLMDCIQWVLWKESSSPELYFNCPLTSTPVPLVNPRIMEYKHLIDIASHYIGDTPCERLMDLVEMSIKEVVSRHNKSRIYEMYYLNDFNVAFIDIGGIKELRYDYLTLERR